ncbi:hypothetical protein BsWGS_00510 [Bradybaena similaris]
MEAKEIKACLKAAREAIRNKDFKEVLKQCRAVLAVDKNNYNALVFVGVATEGMDQPAEAVKAYKKAAAHDPDQLLAWQGLSGVLDKKPLLMEISEACQVFEKLEALNFNGVMKQIDYLHKVADRHINSKDIDKAIEALEALLTVEKSEEDRMKTMRLLLSLLAPSAPNLPQDRLLLYTKTLNEALQSSSLTQEDIIKQTERLLLITYQTDINHLESLAEDLRQQFPTAAPPVEFLLQIHLDRSIISGSPSRESWDNIRDLVAQLTALKEESKLLKAARGFLSLKDKNFTQARDTLHDVSVSCTSGLCCLSQAYLGLHMYQQCLDTCDKGLAACTDSHNILCVPAADVITLFQLMKAQAYRGIGTTDAFIASLAILDEVEQKKPDEAYLIRAYIYLDQGNIEEAQKVLEHLTSDSLQVKVLKAAVFYCAKEYERSLKLLQGILKEEPTDSCATLLLGKVLWQLRDSKEVENVRQECFTTFLKAAKLDPFNYESFLYLGYFYKLIQQDTVKARRCLQKAYDLNPGKDETGCALVDILVELEEEAQSLKILETVTNQAAAGSAKWAWLRLGLYQIKHENPTKAIMSLQSALRADPNDSHIWECLADAYCQRGSLTASLKAFTKASELDPNSLYCLYQIATIKHTLGSQSEAIQEYKHILEKSNNYVPALKGVGESLIHLAKHNLSRCLDGLAKDNFEEALRYLTRAASQRPDLSCLWKLMGDAATLTYCLSAENFSIPSKLVDKGSQDQSLKNVTKAELLQIGARCYSQAVKILEDSGPLWHDLAVNLYYQSQLTTHQEVADRLSWLQRATQAIKRAIASEPKDWRHWNVFGVIACSSLEHKPALAQHCFIRSIECEASNVIAWTNLGTLYLSKGEIELAHDAFKTAQSVDPTYMACWIGQALIAEKIGHEEAMDLFRHTTELGFHPESACGYGQWVLSVLGDISKRDSEYFHYCIHQMAAVPAASDALTRYTGRIKTNPVAYNMQGLLFEHQNLLQSSTDALNNALTLLEKNGPESHINDIRMNLARVLCKQGKYEDSVQQFELCDLSESVEHICLHGLALFSCGRLVDSFKVYQHALELLGDSAKMSQVYSALGMIAYKLGDMEEAKSQLFDGFQTTPPSFQGLLALCALGLLQQDLTLANAVLEELSKQESQGKLMKHKLLLQMYKFIIEGDADKAEAHLRQVLETSPYDGSLWSLFAVFLLQQCTNRGESVTECALSALSVDGFDERQTATVLHCLGQLLSGHHNRLHGDRNALKTAQKAFHLNPGCKSALSTLVCAVHAEAVIRRSLTGEAGLFTVERGLLNILWESGKLNDELHRWCLQQLIVNCIEESDVNSAQAFLKILQDSGPMAGEIQSFSRAVSMFLSSTVDEKVEMNTSNKLQILVACTLHVHNQHYEEAIEFLQKYVDHNDVQQNPSLFKNILERIVHTAYTGLQDQPGNSNLKETLGSTAKSMQEKKIPSAIASLLQALLALEDNKRLAKHLLATALDQVNANKELGHCSSVIRQTLITLLWDSTKESDQKLIQALMNDAHSNRDSLTCRVYEKLSKK